MKFYKIPKLCVRNRSSHNGHAGAMAGRMTFTSLRSETTAPDAFAPAAWFTRSCLAILKSSERNCDALHVGLACARLVA